jgi:hypothetical protein
MRKILAMTAAVVLVGGCGDSGPRDPATLSTCPDLAAEAVARFEVVLADIEATQKRGESTPSDAFQTELTALWARAAELDCDVGDLNDRVVEAVAGVEASTVQGRFVLEQVQVRGLFDAP